MLKCLKLHVPSIFDINYVKKQNRLHKIKQDLEHIYESAIKILGKEEVDKMGIWEREKIEWSCEKEEIVEFESYSSMVEYS